MSLAVAAVFARTRWLAVAQAAGFAATVTLAIGWSFESLTSTRKLALVSMASLLSCLLVESVRSRLATVTCVLVPAAASTWVFWRLLDQKEFTAAMVAGAAAAAYVAWQVAAMLGVSNDPVRGAAGAAVLGFGTGVLAILGASAVLGVAALAAGSAAGATLLVQLLRREASPAGTSISLPSSTAAALVGVSAILTATLPWYALLPMLAVVPAVVFARQPGAWRRGTSALVFALVPAAAAVALAWFFPA